MSDKSDNGARNGMVLEQFLRGSRTTGERNIGLFRLVLTVLAFGAFLLWTLLYPAERPPTLLWVYLVQLLHIGLSAALLALLSRDIDPVPLGHVTAAMDVVLATATMALFVGGQWSGPRAEIITRFAPLLFVTFMLFSIGRHNPRNSLLSGALLCAAYVLLRAMGGAALHDEPVVQALSLSMLLAGVVGGWLVSREALRLALKTAQAEHALHREQVYLLRLFESTPEAVALTTPEGSIIRANAAFLSLFGYGEEDAAHHPIDELIAPAHLAEEARSFSVTSAHGQGINVETVRRRKDGTPVDVSVLTVPVFLDGAQVAIFGVYRSIGERRRKERFFEALNRTALGMLHASTEEEAFQAAASELDAMGFSSVLLMLDEKAAFLRLAHARVQQSRLELIEAAIGRPLLGLEVPLAAGTPYAKLIGQRDPLFQAEKSAVVHGVFPGLSEERAVKLVRILNSLPSITAPLLRNGKALGLFIVLAPDLVSGDIPAIGAFAHQLAASLVKVGLIRELEQNLRQLKLTQEQFLQSQKFEAMGRLAGGVAHDFNNLLTVINGYSELLVEGIPSSDAHYQEAVEILRAGQRAAELTGNLLAFSRKQVLKLELVGLNAVVESMRNALLRLLGEDIELVVELAPSLPKVKVDTTQLAQAILNIALNARDEMGEGGVLTVRTFVATPDAVLSASPIEVRGERYVCVCVEDSGTGIPPEVLPRIFEPFFTTKEPGRGTGLGLAMVYGFVQQSGGYVHAENRTEGGARFSIYLPPAEEETAAAVVAEAPAGKNRPSGTEKILLVEDDPAVLAFTRSVLERAGYRVLSLPRAADALAPDPSILEEISLLVTDIVMPGMNGKLLAEELGSRRPGLKVLFLSGYAEDVFSRFGIPSGGFAFLRKPYSGPELLARVREVLDA